MRLRWCPGGRRVLSHQAVRADAELQVVENQRESAPVRQTVIATLGRTDDLAARVRWPHCSPPAPGSATRSCCSPPGCVAKAERDTTGVGGRRFQRPSQTDWQRRRSAPACRGRRRSNLPLPDHRHRLVAGQRPRGGSRAPKAEPRPDQPFDPSVILFNDVVQYLHCRRRREAPQPARRFISAMARG